MEMFRPAAAAAAAAAKTTGYPEGRSVHAPSSSINDMFKVAIEMQQIVTVLNEVVSEKDKIAVITKMVLHLVKENGQQRTRRSQTREM
jgi:hypothetical protein